MSVNRRPTGGGAILMGEDQLGVALMLRHWKGSKAPRELMRHFASALSEGLLVFGIKAQFRGKNDLEVEGRKIGGWVSIVMHLEDTFCIARFWLILIYP